jgi:Fungal pheromone mating factor STE2 GPCR
VCLDLLCRRSSNTIFICQHGYNLQLAQTCSPSAILYTFSRSCSFVQLHPQIVFDLLRYSCSDKDLLTSLDSQYKNCLLFPFSLVEMNVFPNFTVGTNYSVPPDFDPVSQPIWYLLQNGTVHKPFTFDEIDGQYYWAGQWCVVYGCTIGASVMTLLHVLALTPLTKRRTFIFWANVIGLCQVLARGIIANLFYTRDKFATFYVALSGDSTSVPVLHRIHSTMSVILSLTTILTVEIIFFVQGRAILSPLPPVMYFSIISALVFFGIVAVTIRLIYAVFNIQDIWIWNHVDRDTSNIPHWCEPASKSLHIATSW